MKRSEGPCSGVMSQHEGNSMELAGCPLVEVECILLKYCFAELFQGRHYTPGFIQGVAIGNDCSH